jgi:pseudo-rSAM protein
MQCDPERLVNTPDHQEGENLYANLTTLTIYLNRDIHGSELYQKQFTFPSQSNSMPTESFLDIIGLQKFINSNPIQFLSQVEVCGDVFKYKDWIQLSHLLINTLKVNFTLHLRYPTIIKNLDRIKNGEFSQCDLKILVLPEDNLSAIEDIKRSLPSFFDKVAWSYVITSEHDIESYEERIKDMESTMENLLPVYNGLNKHFFEDFIFINECDILSSGLSKREIFAHQAINTFFFGKLIIDCDGKVYSNLNSPSIGDINTPLSTLLNKEISNSSSVWRMIRGRKPCANCIYQYLCPSPSNYELVMDRLNLCSVMTI